MIRHCLLVVIICDVHLGREAVQRRLAFELADLHLARAVLQQAEWKSTTYPDEFV